jgi:lysozyme
MIDRRRAGIAGLAASASVFVSLLMHEGYSDNAIVPVPGDVPTIGFGTTEGVKPGDHITAPRAVARALVDVQKFEGALKTCIKVPLAQYEYDAYVSLAYNIGSGAFCGSTLVKNLNAGDYDAACLAILSWDKFKGKPLRGLTIRRQAEYKMCIGTT